MRVALVGAELEENLALRHLHAALAAAGHEAEIFDFHEPGQTGTTVREIVAYGPDVVGLSMVFTARAREFVELARALRGVGFAGHLTAGGHFASFHADNLLADFPAFDSIVHGEGEETLPDLASHVADLMPCPEGMDHIQGGATGGLPASADPHWRTSRQWHPAHGSYASSLETALTSVAGISFRATDGRIVRTAARPNPDNLDSRPPPTRPAQFDTYLGLPIANMLSGRGCFGRCNFCSIGAWYRQNPGRRFRQRRTDRVAREMAGLYHDRGVRIYNFHDDNFFLGRPEASVARMRELKGHLDDLAVGRIGIQVKARPDSITPQVVSALTDLGCFRVFLGVESNAVAGLVALGRGIRREQNEEALRLVRAAGIHVTFNLLWFEPDASLSDVRDNVAFIRRWAMVPLNFCRTEVYTGTPLEARLRAEGRLRGDYFGYHYQIADQRVQRAFEIGHRVFAHRQFADDGLNFRAMRIDYGWHILRHFWPERAKPAVGRRAEAWIRRLNGSSADLMDDICNYVETHDIGDASAVEAFAAGLAARREAFDAGLRGRASAILARINSLRPTAGESRRRFLAQAAGAAAAVLLATPTAHTAMEERAARPPNDPVPHPPATEPAPEPPDRPKEPPKEPPKDKGKPPEPPKPRPKDKDSLPDDQAAAVQKRVSDVYQATVKQLAEKMSDGGKPLETKLFITTDGSVDRVQFWPGDDRPGGTFLDKLTGQIFDWKFPEVRQAGTCFVTLELPARPPGTGRRPIRDDGGTIMFEMAPRGPRD